MKEITLEIAEKMLEAAERWAGLAGYPSSIAVVDEAGAVIAVHRMDGVNPMTADIAINKAFTAAYTGAPTLMMARGIDPRTVGPIIGSGGLGMLTQAKLRLMFIPGGIPIRNDKAGSMVGEVIGGIGCSGVPDGVGEISDTTAAQAGYAAIYD